MNEGETMELTLSIIKYMREELDKKKTFNETIQFLTMLDYDLGNLEAHLETIHSKMIEEYLDESED